MKKILSYALTLALLLSMLPPALAAPESKSAEDFAADYAVEVIPEEESDAAGEDTPSEESPARHTRAEARASADVHPISAPVGNEIATLAANCTVTFNITLPQAASENCWVDLSLYSPATVGSTGIVTKSPSSRYANDVRVTKGTSSASITFSNIPAGDYIPVVTVNSTALGVVPHQDFFFNEDGSIASNAYTADPVTISRSRSIALSLPKAERTISGTVYFSTALTKDYEFDFYLTGSGNYSSQETYFYAVASKGDTSVNFSIPVAAGSYSLELSNYMDDRWGWYDVSGGISENDESRAYLSTFQSSVTGLSINGDALLGSSTEEEETIGHDVDVTITLPEAASVEKKYAILLYNLTYNEVWSRSFVSVPAGQKTITDQFQLEEDMKFTVGYMDVTNYSAFSWSEDYPGIRFQGQTGITSQPDNAISYTMGTQNMSVTINDTANYKLTGTLKLSSAKSLDSSAFAMVSFGNGETFGARVNFPAGTTSARYSIYVPTTQSGTFTHWAAEAADGQGVLLNEATRKDGNNYTLSNNLSLADLTMPVTTPNVTGTLSLPGTMTAPKGGLALRFRVNNLDVGHYYMAAGKSSVNFSFATSLYENNAENQLRVYVLNAPDNLADQFRITGAEDGTMTGLSLTIPETVVVSGTITVPEAARSKSTVFELSSYTNFPDDDTAYGLYRNYNNSIYVTTLPGQITTGYALKLIKGFNSQFYSAVSSDTTGKVLSTAQYLQADGTVSTEETSKAKLTQNTTVNFTYGEGKTISGTITLASGLTSDYYYGEVYAQPVSGSSSDCHTSFSFSGTSGTYALAVPADYTGAYIVYFYVYSDESNALTYTQIYYSSTGMTQDYDAATEVTPPADNINLVIQPARIISGTVILPDGVGDGYFSGNVCAIDSDNEEYDCYFESDFLDYTVKVPSNYTGTYKLAVYFHPIDDTPSGLITDTYLYLTQSGTLSTNEEDAAEFTVGASGLSKDLTVPLGKTYTVTLNAPEGYSGYYDGYLRMYDLDTNTNLTQKYFTFNGTSTTLTFTFLSGSTPNYTFRFCLYSGPGAITDTNCYYANGTWVTDSDDATALDLTASSITVTMPKAKTVTINLKAPDDLTGNYSGMLNLYDKDTGNYLAEQSFSFSGSSTSITFTAPISTTNYTLGIYLESGPGVLLDDYYYYAGNSWTESFDSSTTLTLTNDAATVTLPKARTITITLNAPTGLSGAYSGYLQLYDMGTGSGLSTEYFDFTGSSDALSFTVPADTSAQYTLRLRVYSGPGVITGQNFYYAGSTWVTSYSSATALTLSNDAAAVTMPKAKLITGKVVSADGSALLADPEAISLSLYQISESGYVSSVSTRSTVDANGNYTITVPSNLTGTFYLQLRISAGSGNSSNIVPNYYYYKSGATTPVTNYDSSDESFRFTVGEAEVTSLNIPVEIGYVLTGTVKLDSTATLISEDEDDDYLAYTYLYFESDSFDTGCAVYLTNGATSWNYSVVVPKTAATYSMSVSEVDLYYGVTSNLYTGTMNCGTVDISGNTALPDIVLKPAKTTIQATITSPVADYVYGYLYIQTGEDTTYDYYFNLDEGSTDTVAVPLSPTDTAETYQMYYMAYGANGIIRSTEIYVASDGSLTTDPASAGSFAMTKTSHTFTLMELAPYATGKIYLPDGLDDEDFELTLQSSYSYQDIEISSDTIQTAPDGRKYVPYALYDQDATVGSTYSLYYYLYYYSGALLYNGSHSTYLLSDGSIAYDSDDAFLFTVPAGGTTNLDFTLVTWNDGNENNVLQSAHGISTDESGTLTYTYVYPGATKLKVTFDKRTDTTLYINGGYNSYYNLAGNTKTFSLTDGTLTISFTPSNSYYDYAYGFGITSIELYDESEQVTAPAVASVWSERGTGDDAVMAALKDGENVRIALVAPTTASGTLFSALYDANGKLLEVHPSTPTLTSGQAFCDLTFQPTEDAASLKLMYVDPTARKPQMACTSIDPDSASDPL